MWRVLPAIALVVAAGASAFAQPAAGVDAVDRSGWTALQRAAETGDTAEIAALLAKGANLEASSPEVYHGATPLVIALEFGQAEAAKLLLDRGASTAGPIGGDALTLAAREGLDPIVARLLARHVPFAGTRALHAAAREGHVPTLRRLLKAGAKVEEPDSGDDGYTALIVACQEGQLRAARALLAAGANVNARDGDGTTALHWAVYAARPVERHTYEHGDRPHTTQHLPRATAPLVKLLVARGAKVNAVDAQHNTALHQAAMVNALAAARILVAAGANRALRNDDGKSAYELAKDRDNSVERVLRPGRRKR